LIFGIAKLERWNHGLDRLGRIQVGRVLRRRPYAVHFVRTQPITRIVR